MGRALTKIQAVVILVVILIALTASIIIYFTQKPGVVETTTPITTPSPTTPTLTETPSPTPSPTPTTPTETPVEEYFVTIGNVSIKVSKEFNQFIESVKAGHINVTIYFGHALSEEERPAFQKIIEMFENEYPGINVIEIPYASMDTLKSQISAIAALPPEQREQHIGKVPDLFTWAHDWIGGFADKEWIIPLEEVLDYETIIEDIRPLLLPVAFESVRYNLKTYGLPYAGEAIALIINKRLVNITPNTFDEMKSIMESFYNPANEKFGLSLQFDPYHIYPFITAFGGYYYDPIRTGYERFGVNSTGTKEGVKFFIRNVLRYLDTSNLGSVYQLNLFLTQRTPMIITGPWYMRAIIKDIGLENITIIPIPSIDDKVPKPFSGFRNIYVTIMARLGGFERLYASILFVLYVCLNDQALKILVDENNYIPVKWSVVEYVLNSKDKYPVVYGFLQQLLKSTPMPNDPLMDKAWGIGTYLNAIISAFTSALAEGKSIEEAIEAAVAITDEKLDEAYSSIISTLQSS